MGRPMKKLTPAQVVEVETLAAVLSTEQVCDYFGMGKVTFLEICKRQPEVLERYKRGQSRAIGTVAKGLLQQARAGNLTAAIFYLKTRAGWRETTQINHADAEGKNLPPPAANNVDVKLSVAEFREIAQDVADNT